MHTLGPESDDHVACVSRLATSQMRIPLVPHAARRRPSGLKAASNTALSSMYLQEKTSRPVAASHTVTRATDGLRAARSLPSGLKDGASIPEESRSMVTTACRVARSQIRIECGES